ncbi:MAG: methyl-accepting chemotaxis protein, partial [Afipia sp.]|nr:methyl-accepting chemotaxis protein [Afipia sp.]
MAFGLFRKRQPEQAMPDIAPEAAPAAAPESVAADHDSAREILELLELELVAMVRQLERAANSVASGAQSTATTLHAIRHRADALTDRTSDAQATAETFSQAA